jgi:hypothetical protein
MTDCNVLNKTVVDLFGFNGILLKQSETEKKLTVFEYEMRNAQTAPEETSNSPVKIPTRIQIWSITTDWSPKPPEHKRFYSSRERAR